MLLYRGSLTKTQLKLDTERGIRSQVKCFKMHSKIFKKLLLKNVYILCLDEVHKS